MGGTFINVYVPMYQKKVLNHEDAEFKESYLTYLLSCSLSIGDFIA